MPSFLKPAVAVSGGADSLATLAELARSGADVVAVHAVFGQYLEAEDRSLLVRARISQAEPDCGAAAGMNQLAPFGCSWPDNAGASDAGRIFFLDPAVLAQTDPLIQKIHNACLELGVPLLVADCSGIFEEKVVRPFVASYIAGKTPNPCAVCNANVKFGALLGAVLGGVAAGASIFEADHIVTGHYARLLHPHRPDLAVAEFGPAFDPQRLFKDEKDPILLQGADPVKDQSYFLSMVPLASLARARFPLGGRLKSSVVADLRDRNIQVPQPGESQEICFVPGNEYREFLPRMAARLGLRMPGPGPALMPDGKKLGGHDGLWRYTEGQRRGLGIAYSEPLHVLAKEPEGNILRIGTRDMMRVGGCYCENPNILLPFERWPDTVLVKTRYLQQPVKARSKVTSPATGARRLEISFALPERSIAPGQIAAVYAEIPGLYEADGRPVLRLIAGGEIKGPINEGA